MYGNSRFDDVLKELEDDNQVDVVDLKEQESSIISEERRNGKSLQGKTW